MTEQKTNEAALNLVKSLQEANKAIAETATASQEKNMAFVQSLLESGMEVLKSNAESTRALLQELVAQAKAQKGQEALQTAIDSALVAQERNTRYAQSVFEQGIEALKSQVGITRTLMQELGTQAQKQQDAFQALTQQSVEAYMSLFRAPFSYYQQALDAAEVATRQSIDRFQAATRQGIEFMQGVTKQAQQAASQPAKKPAK
jgi:polyhydroxyalkanoate synthesis regulator phasin